MKRIRHKDLLDIKILRGICIVLIHSCAFCNKKNKEFCIHVDICLFIVVTLCSLFLRDNQNS